VSVIIPAQSGWAITAEGTADIRIIAWEIPERDDEIDNDTDPIPITRWGRENVPHDHITFDGDPDGP
jgi:uncharacterized protein YqkB